MEVKCISSAALAHPFTCQQTVGQSWVLCCSATCFASLSAKTRISMWPRPRLASRVSNRVNIDHWTYIRPLYLLVGCCHPTPTCLRLAECTVARPCLTGSNVVARVTNMIKPKAATMQTIICKTFWIPWEHYSQNNTDWEHLFVSLSSYQVFWCYKILQDGVWID